MKRFSLSLVISLLASISMYAGPFLIKNSAGEVQFKVVDKADRSGSVIYANHDGRQIVVGITDRMLSEDDQLPPLLSKITESPRRVAYNPAKQQQIINVRWGCGPKIEPLITTKWNQGWPYNTQCPEFDGKNALTGCSATAMAQLLNYYRSPAGCSAVTGSGSTLPATDFDYSLMRDVYPATQDGSVSNESVEAVSKLMHYCGEAIKTRYGANGSSSNNDDVITALNDIFGLKGGAMVYKKEDDYNNSFGKTIYESLAQGYPLIYFGYKQNMAGHAFICDGYLGYGYSQFIFDENDDYTTIDIDNNMFHFNWGWSGTADGYYNIDYLESYPIFNCVIAGIHADIPEYPDNGSDNSDKTFGQSISPMTNTVWNNKSPYIPNGIYAYASAVPAVAQLFYYNKYPEAYDNSKLPYETPWCYSLFSSDYDYSLMPTGKGGSADRHLYKSAIVDLTEVLAQTFDWDKDTNNEVLFSDVLFALNTCWSYPDAYIDKRLYYKFDCDAWVKKIYDHLAAGHPVLFEASNGETSHVAVIDGYQDGYMFHFNWGDRDVSLNDYYDIRNPRGFSSSQQAIFNVIAPATNSLSPVPESADPALCGDCEVYNLSGICMGRFPDIDNAKESLPAGIYIVKTGASVSKIVIR